MGPPERKKTKIENSESEIQKDYEAFVEAYCSSSDDLKELATEKAKKQWSLVKHDQTEIARKIAEFKKKATGLTAFQPVSRKMTPLSKDLSGVVLKPIYHGSHLG